MTTPPPLSEHARDLLASVGELREPTVDVETSLAAVHERLGAGPPPPDGNAGSGSAASGGGLKLVVGALAASVVIGVTAWALRSGTEPEAPTPTPSTSSATLDESAAEPEAEPTITPEQTPTPALPSRMPAEARTDPAPVSAPETPAPKPSVTAPPARRNPARRSTAKPSAEDALTAELRLIDRARAQLRDRRFNAALTSLERHARAFPKGQLVDEREVMLVEALCGGGKVERAKSRAHAFRVAHPTSPFVHRLRDSCAS